MLHVCSCPPKGLGEYPAVALCPAFIVSTIEDEDGDSIQDLVRCDRERRQGSDQDRAGEHLGLGLEYCRRHDGAIGEPEGDRSGNRWKNA